MIQKSVARSGKKWFLGKIWLILWVEYLFYIPRLNPRLRNSVIFPSVDHWPKTIILLIQSTSPLFNDSTNSCFCPYPDKKSFNLRTPLVESCTCCCTRIWSLVIKGNDVHFNVSFVRKLSFNLLTLLEAMNSSLQSSLSVADNNIYVAGSPILSLSQ